MILYSAECATQVALDGIQCFGEWPPSPLPFPGLACGCLQKEVSPSPLSLSFSELQQGWCYLAASAPVITRTWKSK